MTDYVTDYVRHAGMVKRYHTWPTIQSQTVGEHSWQVALIFEKIFGELSSAVERYIRLHDVAELVVGDPPFPVKANNPDLKAAYVKAEEEALIRMELGKLHELHPEYMHQIKICDLLEMMQFGMTERELGNRLGIPIIVRTREAALKIARGYPDWGGKVVAFIQDAEYRHIKVLSQNEE
jgi:5'-deoxynucleotidase YfbR-like HD superfamily hydrolase